jgi:hypothetical protein
MTPADRARIAAEWGIDPAAIPEPRIIPRGVSGEPPPCHWSEMRLRDGRILRRLWRMKKLAKAEGRLQ